MCESDEYDLAMEVAFLGSVSKAYVKVENFARGREFESQIRLGHLLDQWKAEGLLLGIEMRFPALGFSKTAYKVMRSDMDRRVRDWTFTAFTDCESDDTIYQDPETTAAALFNESLNNKGEYAVVLREYSHDVGALAQFVTFGRQSSKIVQDYFIASTGRTQAKIELSHEVLEDGEAEKYGHSKVDELGRRQNRLDMLFRLTGEINLN